MTDTARVSILLAALAVGVAEALGLLRGASVFAWAVVLWVEG